MPKPKVANSIKLRAIIVEFPDEGLKIVEGTLQCSFCIAKVSFEPKSLVAQHVRTDKHKNNKLKNSKQSFIDSYSAPSTFNWDLCRALIKSDIPVYKLQSKDFRSFLEKYTNHPIPDESTIRKTVVGKLYEDTMQQIRTLLENELIWVSMDEMTDKENRSIVNVVVSAINSDGFKPYLICVECIEKCDHNTIARIFDKAMHELWPNGVKHDNVVVFVTDAAPYMVKSAECIKVFYSRLISITCVAHGLHRLCEAIRNQNELVDDIIATTKKIFLKAPSRCRKLKEMHPNLPLPPKPIVTRWGSWLSAVDYYCSNWDKIKNVVGSLEHDANCVVKGQALMKSTEAISKIMSISNNFGFLVRQIEILEGHLKMGDAIKSIDVIVERTKSQTGSFSYANSKLQAILKKNKGLNVLRNINEIINDEQDYDESTGFTPAELLKFTYVQLTSVDVERSFSRYKAILRDNRRSFIFENLKKYVIVNCNNFDKKFLDVE